MEGLFSGLTVKAQSAVLQRQELDHALSMGKAGGGQTSRSTVKSELKSLFLSHCLRRTPRGPGAPFPGLQEGCPPGQSAAELRLFGVGGSWLLD